MDSRHDSFVNFEDKDDGSPRYTGVPSSPLSSIPGDFESQSIPQYMGDLFMLENSMEEIGSPVTPVPDSAVADTVHVAPAEMAPVDFHSYVRRSDRKRKRPARYSQDPELSTISEPEVDEVPEVSERPTKQRKISQSKTVREARGRGKQTLDVAIPPEPVETAQPGSDESPASSNEVEELMCLVENQSKKSKIIKIKVDAERLGQILHSSTMDTSVPDPSLPGPSASEPSSTIPATPASSIPGPSAPVIPQEHTPPSSPTFEPNVVLPETQITFNDLVALSVSLTKKVPIEQKPNPSGQPEIWADTRHHLCESLTGLYSSWQGSYYGKNGVAKAFMLDGNGHTRDHLDEDVIILRASGSMAKDDDKSMKQREDQEQKHQYHAMVNAINQQSPIAVICGDRNIQVPSKMPHKYNSLDWYKATHVWTEKDRYRVIKYRLERLDPSTPSWWVPENTEPIVRLGALGPPVRDCCGSCGNQYDQLYLCGWLCLNSKCDKFWRLSDDSIPDAAQLLYDPRFLKQKTPWANEEAPLTFCFPLYFASAIAGEDYKVENLRGLTCPECGKCNARVKWEGWECTHCGFEHKPVMNLLPAASIQNQNHPVTTAYPSSHDSASPHIKVSVNFSHNYRWITYKFQVSATEEGEVVHGIANQVVREEQEGPNEMWEHLQGNCHGLVRRELSNALMNSFTINYGMPYKFIAAGDSLSFTDAPWPVTEAVSRLNWADRITSGNAVEDQEKFNELYLVAYLQDQSMNYHDDGEKGLGATVATLSLGARADMGFKPKAPFYHGMRSATHKGKKMTVMTMDEPLPEFPNYELRKQFIEEIKNADLSKDEEMARLAEMAKELQASYPPKKSHTKVDDYIKLSLGHGDICIMRGAHLQKWFEHGVSPKGLMRYALTCRTVLPGHLKKSELPDYDVDLVQNEYDGSRIAR
ncbi:hypothetical protein D6C95_02271 [Aureobasidium pullulans]|nr:hypothetical protein D6C95_02271 [Aureobasidium pullulans]